MVQIIDFQITANGSNQALNSFPALQNVDKVAHIRIEPVRGGGTHDGFVVGPAGNTLHQILTPQTGAPLDCWVCTPDLMEGGFIQTSKISFRGTSGETWNVYVLVR